MTRSKRQAVLFGDGSSDKLLEHPLSWLLRDLDRDRVWDFLPFRYGSPQNYGDWLSEFAANRNAVDLVFAHRDSEGESREKRLDEIYLPFRNRHEKRETVVPVIPVRMTEAWFLFWEEELRYAADNPNGRVPLSLPTANQVERIPDCKFALAEALTKASELSKRRKKRFNPRKRFHRLAELIEDYSPLRQLEAFQHLENDLKLALSQIP